jgi:hypothetical protein
MIPSYSGLGRYFLTDVVVPVVKFSVCIPLGIFFIAMDCCCSKKIKKKIVVIDPLPVEETFPKVVFKVPSLKELAKEANNRKVAQELKIKLKSIFDDPIKERLFQYKNLNNIEF